MAASMTQTLKMLSVLRHVSRRACPQHLVRQMSSVAGSFKYSDLQIDLTKNPRPKPDPKKLSFGSEFSDHWLEVDWTEKEGWGTPRISELTDMKIHPAAKVFHYAIELYEGLKAYRGADDKIRLFRPELNMERMVTTAERATLPHLFEGMKAYKGEDGKVRLFRPDLNMVRMRSSAQRSTLPDFDGEELIQCMKKLVSIDSDWVPPSNRPYATSPTLYVRPTMIATEPSLGVAKPNACKLFVMTGPVGPYYPTGFKPVSLLADPQYVRAFEGGVGRYKMGSNYAPTIYIQIEALKKHNCQQVLWLYGPERRITEVGTMNFFMYWTNDQGEKELVTPPLDSGVILPGVTRRSLVEMARQWNEFKVSERELTMDELIQGLHDKRVHEVFGAGTACVVSAVDKIVYADKPIAIPTMEEGAPMTNRFLTELTDIQFGAKPSPWSVQVD